MAVAEMVRDKKRKQTGRWRIGSKV